MNLVQRNRKKCAIGLTILAALFMQFICPATINAHAAKQVSLEYDGQTQTLKATITHTNFSASHYIQKVEIKKNGVLASQQEYNSQPAETFTYSYPISVAAGDTIEVKAYCSRFGSRAESLTIGPQIPSSSK